MGIDDWVLTEETFHTPHICRREDWEKIAGAELIVGVARLMKEESIQNAELL